MVLQTFKGKYWIETWFCCIRSSNDNNSVWWTFFMSLKMWGTRKLCLLSVFKSQVPTKSHFHSLRTLPLLTGSSSKAEVFRKFKTKVIKKTSNHKFDYLSSCISIWNTFNKIKLPFKCTQSALIKNNHTLKPTIYVLLFNYE